ncbi:MAG TPA: pyrroline-5-carboxylate reductase [Rhizomicrobium sp.]|nr:pyrroline-5-carboxylate reductase [Rhizomicrobium sp.]
MSAPILLVGAGKMGTALIRGWIKAGLGPITAVEPNPSAHLQRLEGPTLATDLKRIPHEGWRACVVALKPQVVRSEAARLKPIAASGTLMISIAAGTGVEFLAAQWGHKARIIRAMPNTPGAIDRGITALYASETATADDRALAKSLLSAIGKTVWLKREELIDAATAVSGSGPAYVFVLVDALTKAGIAAGLPPETSAVLARATVTGAGALLDADPRDAAQLARDVATPGGTTEAAFKVLLAKEGGLEALMTRAVAAAKTRAEELTRG